jgi:ABC-type nitrate/sulfonate/bicarbonate transport system permease component
MNRIGAKGTALITGASTGIGAVYADRLAKRGHDLILVARNKERLASLARRLSNCTGRKVETLEADLTSPADLQRVEDILRTNASISMLVNNAGVGAAGTLVASDVDKMDDMIRLNVTALTRLTYAAAPGFVARGNGTIINISSTVAIAPEMLNGVYGGTKAFVIVGETSLGGRIAQAFFWCAVVAIPLGILMASFRWLFELINPVAAPMRAMPLTAFLPAFIALFGMDETMKVAFLWFGMFFYLLAVVVEEVNRVDNSLLETAYTLGAKQRNALWLLFRASFPAIFSSFRILYDIGWTYVILAEMVNSRKGVGYMVEAARKVLDFERVYAGIIAIGIAAFLFRFLLTFLEGRLFPWRKGSSTFSGSGAAVPSATAHLKAAKHGA